MFYPAGDQCGEGLYVVSAWDKGMRFEEKINE